VHNAAYGKLSISSVSGPSAVAAELTLSAAYQPLAFSALGLTNDWFKSAAGIHYCWASRQGLGHWLP
jgi:hypothetical protein